MLVDVILRDARVVTGAGPGTDSPAEVDRMAVLNGRVVAIGDDAAGLTAREVVSLGGRTVLPGFNDAHAHSVWYGMTLIEADLSAVRSLEDVYRVVRSRAAETEPGDWVIASGFNPVLIGGAVPDADALDKASDGRPVWIKHASGHSCQLSGLGMQRAGVGAHLGREIDGGRIVVDETGRATGVLEERAMKLIQDLLLPSSIDTIARALDLATAQYAREGLTSVTDAGVAGGWIGHAPGELAGYQAAREAGTLRTRMQVMPVIDVLQSLSGHDDEPERRGLSGGLRTGWGDDALQLGPVKVFTDGSILGRTAQVTEHYDACPGQHGYLQEDPEVMRARVLAAYAAGWSVALHAVGDAALDLALDIIEEARRRDGARSVPNRVEHGIVVRPDQIDRMARLDVACVMQSSFISTFGEGIRAAVGPERTEWAQPARSVLESGMPLALSSDRPVTAGAPLRGIQSFVERLTEAGREYGHRQRITVQEALAAATVGSAQVTGQRHKGRLVPGQLADVVVLREHPVDVDVSEIHAIPVDATMVGGRFTHRSPEV
ncbi:amidohydrolase [Citricoccus sp. NR2]|uniref:amidohydrolase n=1 Tax=Citricoccus sp. NR2 TaxID=3004095 RepID=UPI0022DE4279|nr:amidohydrolase [Citricoccus sp. NR2]WBL19942.1 amidohydrolase [Citricoccus sp. NR2]